MKITHENILKLGFKKYLRGYKISLRNQPDQYLILSGGKWLVGSQFSLDSGIPVKNTTELLQAFYAIGMLCGERKKQREVRSVLGLR
jgi:hypothetical protein